MSISAPKHIRRAQKTQVRVEASPTEPGNVILTMLSDEYMLTVSMDQDEQHQLTQALLDMSKEALGRFAVAQKAKNQTKPDLN